MEAHIDRLGALAEQAGSSALTLYVLAGVGVAAGMMLWLRGRGLLRPALSVIAGVIFGIGVLVLLPALCPTVPVRPWHGLLVGASAALGVGVLVYRWALVAATASVLGVIGIAATLVVLGGHAGGGNRDQDRDADEGSHAALGPSALAEVATGEDVERAGWMEATREVPISAEGRLAAMGGAVIRLAGYDPRKSASVISGSGSAGAMAHVFGKETDEPATPTTPIGERVSASAAAVVKAIPDGLRPVAERVCDEGAGLLGRTRSAWEATPEPQHAAVVTAGALGAGLGGLLAIWASEWAAAGLSSMLGAAMWLSGMAWLSAAMHAPWRAALDRPGWQWLVIWAGAAAAGMMVQWWGMRPRKKFQRERRVARRPRMS